MEENTHHWWIEGPTLETTITAVTSAIKRHIPSKTAEEISDAFHSGFIIFMENAPENVKRNLLFSRGYLFNAAVNILKNETRRNNKRTHMNNTHSDSTYIVETCSIEHQYEVDDEVQYFLNKLPQNMRNIMQEILTGKKLSEIAQELKIPLKTIEKRHERAMKKLRKSAELEREREIFEVAMSGFWGDRTYSNTTNPRAYEKHFVYIYTDSCTLLSLLRHLCSKFTLWTWG